MHQIQAMPGGPGHVAVLGTGAMGSRIARRLLHAGCEVVVFNRDPVRVEDLVREGARHAPTPRDAADGAGFVLSMVTDDEASREVWLHERSGAAHGLGVDAVAVESSTVSPAWLRELFEALGDRGGSLVDAPVIGSRPQADRGELIWLLGGGAAQVDRVRGLLAPAASAIHHVGDLGQAMALKLAVNAMFSIQVAALAEVLGLLQGSGMDDREALSLLAELPVTSPALRGVSMLIGARDFAPLFPVDLAEKDLGYFTGAARALGAGVPVAQTVRRIFQESRKAGSGGENIAAVARMYVDFTRDQALIDQETP
jgi:3-hydroxyisobutyrate dehydrogenase